MPIWIYTAGEAVPRVLGLVALWGVLLDPLLEKFGLDMQLDSSRLC